MKTDGRTPLADKPEHAVDPGSGAVVAAEMRLADRGAAVAAEMRLADRGDTAMLPDTLQSGARHLAAVETAPRPEAPAESVAGTGTGYHSCETPKALDDRPWRTRSAEPKRRGLLRWRGGDAARPAVANSRPRLLSRVAEVAFKPRAEIVARGFALVLDRRCMRRARLNGRANIERRYLVHVCGDSRGLIMRLLAGPGTPSDLRARLCACVIAVLVPTDGRLVLLLVAVGRQTAAITVTVEPEQID